jgi:hypothetical protein
MNRLAFACDREELCKLGMWMGCGGRAVDNESSEAISSRLLKAFFDAPASEKGRSSLPPVKVVRADRPTEAGPGVDVPPAS